MSKETVRWYTMAFACLTVLLAGACSKKTQRVPDPKPMPKGASFEGVWYSPQYKHMYLAQSGKEVNGVYAYQNGGRLSGTVNGNLLKFQWTDPGTKEKAQRTMSGHGYLKLIQKGGEKKLEGEWGYGEKYTGAGPWTAEYVRELESDDPMRIEDLKEQNEATP